MNEIINDIEIEDQTSELFYLNFNNFYPIYPFNLSPTINKKLTQYNYVLGNKNSFPRPKTKILKKSILLIRRGRQKTSRLFKGQVPYQGRGSTPLPLKKFSACPEKIFLIKTIFLYCHPCLSTGCKEIFVKNIEKK